MNGKKTIIACLTFKTTDYTRMMSMSSETVTETGNDGENRTEKTVVYDGLAVELNSIKDIRIGDIDEERKIIIHETKALGKNNPANYVDKVLNSIKRALNNTQIKEMKNPLLGLVFLSFLSKIQNTLRSDPEDYFVNINLREDESNAENRWKLYDYKADKNIIYSTGITGVIDADISIIDIVEFLKSFKEESSRDKSLYCLFASALLQYRGSADKDEIDADKEIDDAIYIVLRGSDKNNRGILRPFLNDMVIHIHYEIASRFDSPGYPFFIATMMARDFGSSNCYVPEKEEDLTDFMLLYMYMSSIRKVIKKGFYTEYTTEGKYDSKLKGHIDLGGYIRENNGFENDRISYVSRERTVNNRVNRLIVTTYDYLKRHYREMVVNNVDSEREIKGFITYLRSELRGDNDIYNLIRENRERVRHPYYTEYEGLRRTCLRILRNSNTSFWDADVESDLNAVLFEIPDLWELFLEDCMSARIKNKTEILAQDRILFWNMKYTYPDFVFERDEKRILVLDAKFKPVYGKMVSTEGKMHRNDSVLEDVEKCVRDMVISDVNRVGIIAPSNDAPTLYVEIKFSEYNMNDSFFVFIVNIPCLRIKTNRNRYERVLSYYDLNGEAVDEIIGKKDDRIKLYQGWRKAFDMQIDRFSELLNKVIEE